MCKADMIHCAPRLSDSMNDSLCQTQPDKHWVLREAPTWEPSALSQSSLLAGRLIWDKVMVLCLLQRDLTGQSVPSAFRTTAIRVASFTSFFLFWNFSTMLPPPPALLIAAKASLPLQSQQSLPLAILKGTHQTERKDPKDWEECKAAKRIPEKNSEWWTGWWDTRKSKC